MSGKNPALAILYIVLIIIALMNAFLWWVISKVCGVDL